MRRIALLAVLLAGAAAALAAGAGGAQAATSKCQRLKGKDLAPARTVKLVRRRNAEEGTDLVGCVLPRGRLRTIASSSDEYTTQYTYDLRQVAGRIALVTTRYMSQYASSTRTSVWDLRSGRGYTITFACHEIGGYDCTAAGSLVAPAAFVTGAGRAVAAVIPDAGGPVTIAAFTPAGKRIDLDSGPRDAVPPESLRLDGSIASWMRYGNPLSSDLRLSARG